MLSLLFVCQRAKGTVLIAVRHAAAQGTAELLVEDASSSAFSRGLFAAYPMACNRQWRCVVAVSGLFASTYGRFSSLCTAPERIPETCFFVSSRVCGSTWLSTPAQPAIIDLKAPIYIRPTTRQGCRPHRKMSPKTW